MSTYFNGNTNPLGAIMISDHIVNLVLAANTEKHINKNLFPAGATHVLINSNVAGLYVKKNGTASIPAADITDGTGMAIDPVFVELENVSRFSFINASACIVSLSFYKKA